MKSIATLIVGLVGVVACGLGRLLPVLDLDRATPESPACVRTEQVVTKRIDFGLMSENSLENSHFSESATSADDQASSGDVKANLQRKMDMLEQGEKFLAGIDSYCAQLSKQEVVGDELLDEQTMQLKCRHKPFSVYLRWVTGDTGREVIYIEGQNDGRMIAHDGGWKARIPAFTLHPQCRLAMSDARYPVTTAGLAGLTRIMLDVHREDLQKDCVASCVADEDQIFDGRPCTVFTTHYKSQGSSPTYRKSITYIDNEWNVPVFSRHFEWPRDGKDLDSEGLDDSTLIESYSFTDVKMPTPLNDSDFDRKNPEYRFR